MRIALFTAVLIGSIGGACLAEHEGSKKAPLAEGGAKTSLSIAELSVAALKKAFDRELPRSKADFVRLLPKECLASYTLAFQSKATACSSYEKPRVIFSCSLGGTEPVYIAVDGENPNVPKEACQRVEILESDVRTGEVRSAEVRFDSAGKKASAFEVSPHRCQLCHGVPLRLLADRYPSWPGFYDSSRGNIPVGSAEHRGYEKYKEGGKGDPVYRQLVPLEERIVERFGTKVVDLRRDGANFNSHFFNRLERTHATTSTFLLKQSDRYPRYRLALIGAIQGCTNLPDFFPEARVRARLRTSDAEAKARTDRTNNRVRRNLEATSWSGGITEDQHGVVFDPLTESERNLRNLYFVFREMGFDPLSFSLSASRRELVLDPSRFNKQDFDGVSLGKRDSDRSCEELAERSRGLLSSHPGPRAARPAVAASRPIGTFAKCIDCHLPVLAERLGTIAIPFGNRDELRLALKNEPGLARRILDRIAARDDARMPPQETLDTAELEAIRRAVE